MCSRRRPHYCRRPHAAGGCGLLYLRTDVLSAMPRAGPWGGCQENIKLSRTTHTCTEYLPLVHDGNMASANEEDAVPPAAASASASPAQSLNQPPPETKESLWLRRTVIVSFWAVVAFLGLPIWWKTTAIYRAELPLQSMIDWADGKVGHMDH